MYTLYHHPFCPHSRFIRLALGEYSLDLRLVEERVWERREAYLALRRVELVALGTGSSPHGVIQGPDKAAWLTDGGQNAIVRVGWPGREVRVFPLPAGAPYANLNTATFDHDGDLWFTGQSGVYGRVDPKTGRVDAWAAPKGTGPYGITTTPAGDVWYASLAGDYIGHVDTATGAVMVVDPPRPGVGPRRIWSDSKGVLWVSFWNTGQVGRYDPAAKTWKTWSLPKSGSGAYAVYVDDKDRVWLTDFTANAIVRFDPSSEAFESFPVSRISSCFSRNSRRLVR